MFDNHLKILAIGDVIGKIGRQAILKKLPELKKKYKVDVVIANVENLAHGTGITEKTWREISGLVDVGTSGNHILRKVEAESLLADEKNPIVRPVNFPAGSAGRGYLIYPTDKGEVLIINAIGRIFFKEAEKYNNPFTAVQEILDQHQDKKFAAIIVDFHGEATSEKVAMGLFLDGKVTAVVGTHTHVPTADAKISDKGTATVTDLGMVGATDSIIGGDRELLLVGFVDGVKTAYDIPEHGQCDINAVLIEVDPATGQAVSIERVDSHTEIA